MIAEQSLSYARRVITALIGPTNKARSVVAGRILDDLKGLDVNVSGRPGQEIEVRLMLLLTRETAEAILGAVSPAAPAAAGPAPFAGLDMSDADPGCPGCGSTASVHICPAAPEVMALERVGHHYLMPVEGRIGCDATLPAGVRCGAGRQQHIGTSPDPSE